MTLCMAAVCWDADKSRHRIVFGMDKHAEVDWAGGNVAFKFGWAKRDWPALIAGEISKAQEFLATCRATLAGEDEPITVNNIFDKFNEVSCVHKEKLCQRYVRQKYGITFDRFLAQGESEFTADVRARLFHELA